MVPPKDPYIRVKVLDDIGEVCLGDQSISLTQHSLHFLRRTDAEPFISQVCLPPVQCRILNVLQYPFLITVLYLNIGSHGRVSRVKCGLWFWVH